MMIPALMTIIVFLAATSLLLGRRLILLQKGQRVLAEQAKEGLLTGERTIPFSAGTGSLAELADAVEEQQRRYLLSEERRAQEAGRAGALAADISHQLKTPLAALRLYCEMDPFPHQAPALQQINRMERLVYALLRLEKLAAKGYRFRFEEHRIHTLVREAWEGLDMNREEKRLALSGPDLPLRCDGEWLKEALENLMKNACQHTAPHSLVAVHTECTDSALFIYVEDQGGGVPEDVLPRLFDRFYRSPQSPGTGSGLGLAIAREIVLCHHGSLTAENIPGGLRMAITLPRLDLKAAV